MSSGAAAHATPPRASGGAASSATTRPATAAATPASAVIAAAAQSPLAAAAPLEGETPEDTIARLAAALVAERQRRFQAEKRYNEIRERERRAVSDVDSTQNAHARECPARPRPHLHCRGRRKRDVLCVMVRRRCDRCDFGRADGLAWHAADWVTSLRGQTCTYPLRTALRSRNRSVLREGPSPTCSRAVRRAVPPVPATCYCRALTCTRPVHGIRGGGGVDRE